MDYFSDVLTTVLGHEWGSSVAIFIINDSIFILGELSLLRCFIMLMGEDISHYLMAEKPHNQLLK